MRTNVKRDQKEKKLSKEGMDNPLYALPFNSFIETEEKGKKKRKDWLDYLQQQQHQRGYQVIPCLPERRSRIQRFYGFVPGRNRTPSR